MAIIDRKKRREKKGGGKVQKKRKKKMMIEERCRKSAEEEAKENDDGRRWRSRGHEFRHCLNESKRTKSIKSILNYFSSQLQSKATFKSEFYISNLASAFMSTDTFSSTDPITKNIKEENYKGHSKID